VAKGITTPYVCVAPDDDYLFESSLKAGAHFLDENSDYVSAQGRYLSFELIENQVVFSPRYGRHHSHYAVEDEDRFSRVVRAFNPYMHHLYSIHRIDILIKSIQLSVDILVSQQDFWRGVPFGHQTTRLTEFTQPLIPMCYGKHKVLPILWMARDVNMFDPARLQEKFKNKTKIGKVGQVIFYYRHFNRLVNGFESFLGSQECRLVKEKFSNITSELVNSDKESDMLFNSAFRSLVTGLISERNKIIIKLIIKLFIPTWVLKYYTTRKILQHMGGAETTSSAKEALHKIELSVLTFRKCYDR